MKWKTDTWFFISKVTGVIVWTDDDNSFRYIYNRN